MTRDEYRDKLLSLAARGARLLLDGMEGCGGWRCSRRDVRELEGELVRLIVRHVHEATIEREPAPRAADAGFERFIGALLAVADAAGPAKGGDKGRRSRGGPRRA